MTKLENDNFTFLKINLELLWRAAS